MNKLDSSCCRREKKQCVDPHACDFYGNKTTGKVRLGGIYDPKPSSESLPDVAVPEEEEEEEDDSEARQLNRKQQCELVRGKWNIDFFKQPVKHPLASSDQTPNDIAKKRLIDMEIAQSATEKIVEKFGGLTLGFTGSLPPSVKDGSKIARHFPDPRDLHIKRVCKPRVHTKRNLRVWEKEDSLVEDKTVTASFSPQSSTLSLDKLGGDQKKGREKSVPIHKRQDSGDNDSIHDDTKAVTYSRGSREHVNPSMPISADEFILEYVEKHNLEIMFEYFLSLCCLYTPENPFQFISDLAGRMIKARDNEEEFKNLERVFSPEHVSAVFRLFDKQQNGFVTTKQYKTAMETLGLVRYNKEPDGYESDKITEESFVAEGTKALDLLLQSFLVVDLKS